MATSRGKGRRERASAGGTTVPRYQDLAAELIAAIRDGTFPVGSQFPSEHELCQLHAVSRFTVRSALDTLQRQGWVARKPKVGTIVLAAQPTIRYQVIDTPPQALCHPAHQARLQVLGMEEVMTDAELASWLGCGPGMSWIHVEGLHMPAEGGGALCLASYYVPVSRRAALRGLERAGPRSLPLHARLERVAEGGIGTVQQQITAQKLSRRQARALSVAEGSGALRLAQRMLAAEGNQALYAVVSLHPAERFSFSQTLRRES